VSIPYLARWRGNFLAGLAVLLPTVVKLGVIKCHFFIVSSLTDLLLLFLPQPPRRPSIRSARKRRLRIQLCLASPTSNAVLGQHQRPGQEPVGLSR